MRDAAGELTDRLHLLRLAQLFFEPPPLGDVAHVDDDAGNGRIGEAVDAEHFDDTPREIGVMEPHLRDDRLARMAARLGDARRLKSSRSSGWKNSKIDRPTVCSGVQPRWRSDDGLR